MREICSTVLFTRDLKRIAKRHKNLNKLKEIIRLLASDTPLLPKHRPHKLLGNNFPKWECHIEPDWLLIYELKDDTVILYRTGSHADLF
jgi:mRNA interferase YafQ